MNGSAAELKLCASAKSAELPRIAVSKQCHARQLEDQLGNQIKTNILTNIWLFLAELGLL